MNNKYKILLIEDEENILKFTAALFEANGYQALTARTAEAGLFMVVSHLPDLIVLDLGLPGMDGTEFLHTIRQTNLTPIIVLSARGSEQDKVEALDMGANDYVTKPFSAAELLARIRSLLRNSRRSPEAGRLPAGTFTTGGLVINFDTRRVYLDEEEIKLIQTEFNIMALMSEHFEKVLTYSAIIKEIWGYSDSCSIKRLQVNMANIRKKCICVRAQINIFPMSSVLDTECITTTNKKNERM